jgi:hypothetical protein
LMMDDGMRNTRRRISSITRMGQKFGSQWSGKARLNDASNDINYHRTCGQIGSSHNGWWWP